MEHNYTEAIAQTVAWWAEQIQPTTGMKAKMNEFDAKKAVALEVLREQLIAEIPFHADGVVTCVCSNDAGKYLEAALLAGWGKRSDQNYWPLLTKLCASKTTATTVQAGPSFHGAPELPVIWQGPE